SQRTTTGPISRSGQGLTFDSAQGKTILFGGLTANPNITSNDTWTWDGSSWTRTSASGPMQQRTNLVLVFDSERSVSVMVGGGITSSTGTLAPTDEVWELSGQTWTQRHVEAPPQRAFSAMAFDSSVHSALLFGGENALGELADTWIWNGSIW